MPRPSRFSHVALPLSAALALAFAAAPAAATNAGGGLDLIYFGNSYSQANGTVPDLVALIAEEAGFPAPTTVAELADGADLAYHLANPATMAAITGSLPPGETWDFVVIQGHSLEATATLGSPATFVANAEQLFADVRAHSPAARACLFQTWARGRGHAFYQGTTPTYAGPLAMHDDVEAGYVAAELGMSQLYGQGSTLRAACGEALALRNFSPALYEPDLSHPSARTTLVSAMAIFTAMYGADVCGIEPDFQTPSALAARLASFGLQQADWDELAGYAARVAAPAQRLLPGSGEDLLLRTGVNGLPGGCPGKAVAEGDLVQVTLRTPAGSYLGRPAFVYAELYPAGASPAPSSLHPEVWLSPASAIVLAASPALKSGGIALSFRMPLSVPGGLVALQGVAFGPSAKTGNTEFTTTDGHELRFP